MISTPSWYDVKRRIRNHCTKSILIYELFAKISGSRQVMTEEKSFIIDGFPRSANSYSEALIRVVAPDAVFSHHCHAACQVIKALKCEKPAIVLIRHPVEAVTSYLLHNNNYMYPETLFEEYCIFYRQILRNLTDKNLHFFTFEEVTSDCKAFAENVSRIINIKLPRNLVASELDKVVKVKLLGLNKERGQEPQPYIANSEDMNINKREDLKKSRREAVMMLKNNRFYIESIEIYSQIMSNIRGI